MQTTQKTGGWTCACMCVSEYTEDDCKKTRIALNLTFVLINETWQLAPESTGLDVVVNFMKPEVQKPNCC